jgi:ABC-type spermidine/putrescine transport system permease subunit I
LQDLHVTSQPLTFCCSRFAVVVTSYLFTLLMVGPIASSMAKIDPALLESRVTPAPAAGAPWSMW